MSDGLMPIGGLQPIGGGPVQPEGTGTTVPPSAPPAVVTGPQPLAPPPPVSAAPPLRPSPASPPSSPLPTRPLRPDPVEEPEKPVRWPLYLVGVVVLFGLIGAGSLLIPSTPVDAPANFSPFQASDGSFGCDLPDQWTIQASGKDSEDRLNGDGVIATKSDAKIDISLSTVAGLKTSQLLFGNDPIPSATFGLRSKPIYSADSKYFKKKFRNYHEDKIDATSDMYPKMTGQVQDEMTHELIPDLRWGEFTADGNQYGLGGKRHGYRTAVGGNTYIAYIVCECSERDWPKLQQAFEKVIESVHEAEKPETREDVTAPGGGTLPTNVGVPGIGQDNNGQ